MSATAGIPDIEFSSDPSVKLLTTLYEETVDGLRRNVPDSRTMEEIAQHAGMATVGQPDTRMARAAMEFRALAERGFVEAVKDPDGPLRYRITILGVMWVLDQASAGRERALKEEAARAGSDADHWRGEARRVQRELELAHADLELAEDELAHRRLPFWRRFMRED